MIVFFVGIILLAIPFLLVSRFQDKKKGFVYILFFSILFQALLAILTQAFGIFHYSVAFTAILLADIAVIIYWLGKKSHLGKFPPPLKLRRASKIDWLLLAVIAISFLMLCQVHYRYTGEISVVSDTTAVYHQVKNMEYVYPYFSDEWYAVSLIKYSIASHSLPFKNPLDGYSLINFEVFFHSFLSEIFLILGLNPLTQYNLVSLFFNILIIALAYIFLRFCNISKISSAISSLAILYITCGANFPGTWHLLPITLGILLLFAGFCFIEFGNLKLSVLSFIAVSLFYPPFFIFFGLGLLVFLFQKLKDGPWYPLGRVLKLDKNILKKISYFAFAAILIIPTAYIVLMISPWSSSVNYIASRLFFVSFAGSYIPRYSLYDVIPIPIILLALAGLYPVYKKRKYLFFQLVLGAFLWLLYLFTIYRIVIEFEREALLTSIIVTLISGFGLAEIEKYIEIKFKNTSIPIFKYAGAVVIILFLALAPFYTQRDTWKRFTPLDPATGAFLSPKSPANNYLMPDDLKIFNGIKGKKFLSVPWKGTVIGVATDNYPVVTKPGTISIGSTTMPDEFLKDDCASKTKMAKNLDLDYVYLYDFSCPGFEEISKSSEGFTLFKVSKI